MPYLLFMSYLEKLKLLLYLGLILLFSGPSKSLYAQTNNIRLNDDWKFVKGDLGGIWEAVRTFKAGDPESVPLW